MSSRLSVLYWLHVRSRQGVVSKSVSIVFIWSECCACVYELLTMVGWLPLDTCTRESVREFDKTVSLRLFNLQRSSWASVVRAQQTSDPIGLTSGFVNLTTPVPPSDESCELECSVTTKFRRGAGCICILHYLSCPVDLRLAGHCSNSLRMRVD
jgi:hypothetical protein